MRKRVSDAQIEEAIATLYASNPQWADGHPSVREVARLLKSQLGVRGSTDRICLALRRHRERAEHLGEQGTPEDVRRFAEQWRRRAEELAEQLRAYQAEAGSRIRELEEALAAMERRAMLAEEREVAHQNYWAEKIYELRQQLNARQVSSGVSHEQYLEMHRKLKAARDRIALLEARIIELKSAALRGARPGKENQASASGFEEPVYEEE